MSPKRYTADEVNALRRRFAELTAELNEVFDEIAAKVTALNEELDESDEASGALTASQAVGHDDRPARG